MSFFDINNVIFTILGYDLNGLELLGFITGIIAIYLASCGRVLNFVVGLLNCIIYFAIFFQANLYSMMLLQLIFVGINVYGILKWTMPISNDNKIEKIKITKLSPFYCVLGIVLTILAGFVWGGCVVYLEQKMPEYIQKPIYPLLDAMLLMGNIFGQLLLAMKKIENWYVWIVVNVLSVVLWAVLDMKLTAILYFVYLVIAIDALRKWKRQIILENNKN